MLACNDEETNEHVSSDQEEHEKPEVRTTPSESSKPKTKPLPEMTWEHLVNQEEGKLTANLDVDEKMSDQLVETLEKEITALTDETNDPEQIYRGAVDLLASSYYQTYFEKASTYDPDFEEPYLPDPEIEKKEGKKASPKKAFILLDASSSMLLRVNGKIKMDIAKNAVQRFGEVIGQDSDLSLLVYGHLGSESSEDKQLSCEGIEEVYEMSPYDEETFQASLNSFESKGWTPLAGAIKEAANMSRDFTEDVTVYVVSDGVETCGGDPVAAAEAFTKDSKERKVHIIGFHVDETAENELKKVSDAGNGTYYPADNEEELQDTIQKRWLPSLADLAWAHTKAPGPWEVLGKLEELEKHTNKLTEVRQLETERLNTVYRLIRDHDLLSSEAREDLKALLDERDDEIRTLIKNLTDEKKEDINKQADDIKNRVSEWRDRMYELRDEERDHS
ncbi:vWA domain-containing protein [Lentibacillus sp. JNUCC-1]|uniref:vWA domain-containing protein n=1 Tax=Lentibacillus sp. JNUCC-1 TaxID=2654513 RepID=UPI001E4A4239|nr:VWA domain-containing protein [Lentibacillus sp. JNUCC-1]